MKNQNPLLHTPEGVRDIYGNEFVQKFELQQLLYRVLAGRGYQGIETVSYTHLAGSGSEAASGQPDSAEDY